MEDAGTWRDPGDPYRVLGVSADAPQRDIGRAYRRAVQRVHPDTRPHDRQAAARFQVLTDAYELLRDPDRRAAYDRGHAARQPSGQPPTQSGQPVRVPRWRGSPFLLRPPSSQLIWAGPVRVEPPAATSATGPPGASEPAAEFDDPLVILGVRRGQVSGWPW
jgi:curved DNA-binding protein CbpA